MRRLLLPLALAALIAGLAACSKPAPPRGRWEGGTARSGTIAVARVEIGVDGLVRLSAPHITLDDASPEQWEMQRQRLSALLATAWDGVKAQPFDFDGKTFREPGNAAPQMVWDGKSHQMTLLIYVGTRPPLTLPLRPVDGFHDNPFPHA